MFGYWLLFVSVLIPSLLEINNRNDLFQKKLVLFAGSLIFILMTLLIGFRYQVGGDWYAYLDYVTRAANINLFDVVTQGDPGFIFLNYLANILGGGIYFVNLVSAAIFTFCLISFSKLLPRPFLALLVAVPYMVMVIAMGYTRQSIALGFVLLAIKALQDESIKKYIIWILVAALFHKSAVVLISLAVFFSERNRIINLIGILIAGSVGYIALLQDDVDNLYTNYVEAQYQSQGALIRVIMCLLPSLIFLLFRHRFSLNEMQKKLWTWFSYLSIFCFILLFISSASTAIDRLALYLLPIQLLVFSFLPDIFKKVASIKLVLLISMYCFFVQFVWLFFAKTAFAWLPYRFYPLVIL